MRLPAFCPGVIFLSLASQMEMITKDIVILEDICISCRLLMHASFKSSLNHCFRPDFLVIFLRRQKAQGQHSFLEGTSLFKGLMGRLGGILIANFR